MKRHLALLSTLVLLALPAFAGSKPETVTIPQTVQIGSTRLTAGDYKLTWTGAAPAVQVTLTQRGKAVVTFPATAVTQKNTPSVETRNQGGVDILDTIYLNDMKLSLQTPIQTVQR